MNFQVFVGCDMSKESFHFCLRTQQVIILQGKVDNKKRAIQKWLTQLKIEYGLEHVLIGLEHTGLYNEILLREAYHYGFQVWVENARQIKLSLGLQRGKNDKVDAARVAEYLLRYTDRMRAWKPRREVVAKLAALVQMRNVLVKVKKQLSQRQIEVKRFHTKEVAACILLNSREPLRATTSQIREVEKQIDRLIQTDPKLKRLVQLITSVKGVGKVTAWELIIKTNEFLSFENAKQLACTAGVAPFEHSSGSSIKGKSRVSHHAHKRLKTLLHLCAMAALKNPGELKDYYQRKVGQGKNKMTVVNAVRNKLIHRIFAAVRDDVKYVNNYERKVA